MNNRKLPELLAPVGGWRQLKAAVQNGADAVYMGGPLFNARIKAENFTADEMKEAIDYAHMRNVKVYVTINTLIKDDELSRALSYVNELYGMGADAVILQDMGLARLIRKYLPEMPMHLSTQGTVYNKEAAPLIKELGFCRVVPARELTLGEIRAFTAECHSGKTPCEVEVFVHGALCMCYSGQCQMSRILGGVNERSGNRGLCAQPCRLPYEDEDGNKSFLLSPKDLCTLEHIPQLCEADVDSFKIEGRLKSPQYVAVVTSVYRKYLDQYRDTGHVKVQPSDMQRLTQIFNRGGFTEGYLLGNPGEGLLSGESPKNQGVLVGTVSAVKKGSTLVDVKLLEPGIEKGAPSLSMGDGVEIRGSKVTGNVVTYRKELPDGSLRIGDIRDKVKPGDKVYKVTDKALLDSAEKSYENDDARKVPIEMHFAAALHEPPELRIRERGPQRWISVTGEQPAESAVRKALEKRRVKEQLAKLGDTVFEAADITVQLDENISLPVSAVNKMRRQATERLLTQKCAMDRKALTQEELDDICRREALDNAQESLNDGREPLNSRQEPPDGMQESGAGEAMRHLYSREELTRLSRMESPAERQPSALCIPVELYMDDAFMGNLQERLKRRDKMGGNAASAVAELPEILPYILNVSKGNLDRYIQENFDDICDKVRNSGILIGNPGWISQFREAGIKVYGDYGLNVYNHQSMKAFREMGVEVRAWSHEAEMFFFRNIPLMITEHPVYAEEITDRKGKKYTILRSESGDKHLIFQA